MAESTHRVDVVPVVMEPHPNADSLSIVRVFDGFQVVVRTEDWRDKAIGAYIQPDSLVPVDREPFTFLRRTTEQTHERIKARKLRNQWSMGLLVPAPEGSKIGDDVASILGVTHYDPPETNITRGEAEAAPKRIKNPSTSAEHVALPYPKYDVESFRKFAKKMFEPGEPVWVTEKIHGANGRWLFDGERFYAGSRTEWKKHPGDPSLNNEVLTHVQNMNMWWKALYQNKGIQDFLRNYPGVAVYGEVYGQVQDLKYGHAPGKISIALFDILWDGKWVSPDIMERYSKAYNMPTVPVLERAFPFDFDRLIEMAEGKTLVQWANHVREGIVVKPILEREHQKYGRVCLKIVGNGYLEKA